MEVGVVSHNPWGHTPLERVEMLIADAERSLGQPPTRVTVLPETWVELADEALRGVTGPDGRRQPHPALRFQFGCLMVGDVRIGKHR